MTPGPSEEAGKVAISVIESLKSQPMTLALVIFNVLFLLIVYLGVRASNSAEAEQIKTMLQLLASCLPPSAK